MKFSGIYAICVGILMLAQWSFFLITGNVPELQTEPWSIAFHLAAEAFTAIGLIFSGILVLRQVTLAKETYLVFSGMLIYAMVNSAGYFAQSGDWVFVVMFAVLLLLTGYSLFRLVQPASAINRKNR